MQVERLFQQPATHTFQAHKVNHAKYLVDNRPSMNYQRYQTDLIQRQSKIVIQREKTTTENAADWMAIAAGLLDTLLGLGSVGMGFAGGRRMVIPKNPGTITIGNCIEGYVEKGNLNEDRKSINNGEAFLKLDKITLSNEPFKQENWTSFIMRKIFPPLLQLTGGAGTIVSSICNMLGNDPATAISTIISSCGYISTNALGFAGGPTAADEQQRDETPSGVNVSPEITDQQLQETSIQETSLNEQEDLFPSKEFRTLIKKIVP